MKHYSSHFSPFTPNSIRYKTFWFEVGWYSGNPFKLIGINIGETLEINQKIDMVTFFDFQILRFSLSFGWSK